MKHYEMQKTKNKQDKKHVWNSLKNNKIGVEKKQKWLKLAQVTGKKPTSQLLLAFEGRDWKIKGQESGCWDPSPTITSFGASNLQK